MTVLFMLRLRMLAFSTFATAASWSFSAPEHQSSAFVHLFEWSWPDVAKECEEFLGPKGFTAVQISPPNDHIQGPEWFTRYQPVTYKLVSRSGDKKAFVDMVQRCNKAGVGIYADAVINHIAAGSGVSIAGNRYGRRETPIYKLTEMHHHNTTYRKMGRGEGRHGNCMVTNYSDKWNVQYCDLEGLPDLCTGCPSVQKKVAEYIKQMSDIGIAGIRIDAAKHQDAGELGQLLSQVPEHLYRFQEVINGAGEAIVPSMYFENGQVTEFDYSRYLRSHFLTDGKLRHLDSFGEKWGLSPSSMAVVFIDNHDTQRSEAQHLNYKKGKLYELVNIFMLAHPYGYPKVMSSYHFTDDVMGPPSTPVHSSTGVSCSSRPAFDVSVQQNSSTPWVCEHRWPSLANMVAWRKTAGAHTVTNFQALGDNTIAFCRGDRACVVLNRQKDASWSGRLKFKIPAGRYCDVIQSDDTSSCPAVEVAQDGSAHLNVPPFGAVAFHLGKKRESTRDSTQGNIIFM